jgi:diguanylate cyclase (GGDEF)-like protein/PAS domain S-box-containing protein
MVAEQVDLDAEALRLAVLRSYDILDTPPEQGFDDLVGLAATICSTAMSAVSMVDADRQWFKAQVGLNVPETPRSMSFCQHAMRGDDLMIVPDATMDPRFADNPLVVGAPGIRFYAGAPLVSPEGQPLGALCVIDAFPRDLSDKEAATLRLLARQVSSLLALRRLVGSLTASETRFRTVFHSAPIGAVLLSLAPDQLATMLEVNTEFASMLGYTPAELVGRCYFDLLDNDGAEAARAGFDSVAAGGGGRVDYRVQCHFRRTLGDPILAQVAGAWIGPEAGVPPRLIVHVEDITVVRAAQDELSYLATHDPLTGLANRTQVLKRLAEANARKDGLRRGYLAVLFIDLDRFKTVNDSLGHRAGDELLITIARRIEGVIRSGDLAARVGGDEFVIVCENLGETARLARRRVEALARRIEGAVRLAVPVEGTEAFVSASVGIALSAGGEPPEDLMRDADTAMYSAKQRGANRVKMFDSGLRTIMVQRQTLETGLHRALERGELVLHYQPVIDLGSGLAVGAEALMRWRHPERGVLAPGAFIAVAEETGLIVPIGVWALEQACRDLVSWRAECGANLSVAVNLSARQLAYGDLVDHVRTALGASRLPADALRLEVTETALLDLSGPARLQLEELRGLGVGLSIDDFGTGYASLTYLKNLPVDCVKIDRSFVTDLGSSRSDTAIVAAVLSLAASLDLQVVAEGVETIDQEERLASMGCGFGQGYLWSRPRPLEQLRSLHPELAPLRTPAAAAQPLG